MTSIPSAPWLLVILVMLAVGLVFAGMRVIGSRATTTLSSSDAAPDGTGEEQDTSEEPGDGDESHIQDPGSGSGGSGKSSSSGGSGTAGSTGGQGAGSSFSCEPGKNGGRTDIGISANKIRIATTYIGDPGDPYADLMKESIYGIRAVIERTNREGGICGRILELQKTPVSSRADSGYQALKNYLDPKADIFALAAPSPHALSSAIKGKDIATAGIPVVGTDGLHLDQYQEPWVWPVGTATVSQMRIIAKYAYNVKDARTFAIVWDKTETFGQEGREAFVAQVVALGGTVRADVPLDGNQGGSYTNEIADFNSSEKCGNDACDAVVWLLLPDTARRWMYSNNNPAMGKLYSAAGQTLSTKRFEENCHGCPVVIWTGYIADVARYSNDVKAIIPSFDLKNQFTEGAYLGTSLLVEAIKRAGPNLTRAELKKVLDSMDYYSDLASTLSWRPGMHHANIRARAIGYETGWVLDPAFGG